MPLLYSVIQKSLLEHGLREFDSQTVDGGSIVEIDVSLWSSRRWFEADAAYDLEKDGSKRLSIILPRRGLKIGDVLTALISQMLKSLNWRAVAVHLTASNDSIVY